MLFKLTIALLKRLFNGQAGQAGQARSNASPSAPLVCKTPRVDYIGPAELKTIIDMLVCFPAPVQ